MYDLEKVSRIIDDKKLGMDIEKIVRERNLFAHHYYSANPKTIIKVSKDIYVVKVFMEKVKKIVGKGK